MKRYGIFALVLVLTSALLLGCGCTGRDMESTSQPSILPTNEEVRPTTEATTQPTTEMTTIPTTDATEPSQTIDHGNGPLETSGETTGGDQNNQARQMMPGRN